MPNPLLVPVVAHRVFGRSFRAVRVRPSGGRTPANPFMPGVPVGPVFELTQVVDTSHGTRRSIEEIERLFHEGETPAFTRGWSINRLWSQAGVQFVLAGVTDQMIDSHMADFVPADTRLRPDLSAMRYENAINVFFCRALQGARGFWTGNEIFMGDRWNPDAPEESREDAWFGDVITMSHEIGHAFGLSHRGDANNVMHAGTVSTSKTLEPAQALFAQQRARNFRRPWYRAIPPDDDVRAATIPVPHAAGYAGERLPTFD